MAAAFAAGDEDYITLAGVGVLVLEEKELVDPVVLQSRNLDKGPYRACKALLKDYVLLSAHLQQPSQSRGGRNMQR